MSLNTCQLPSGPVLSDYFVFVLLTGVRREEARLLIMKRGVFRLIDTKNREVVEQPMSPPLLELMRSRLTSQPFSYVFPTEFEDKPFASFKRH